MTVTTTMVTRILADDDDNDVDGDGATGNKVDNDGKGTGGNKVEDDGDSATTTKTTTMATIMTMATAMARWAAAQEYTTMLATGDGIRDTTMMVTMMLVDDGNDDDNNVNGDGAMGVTTNDDYDNDGVRF